MLTQQIRFNVLTLSLSALLGFATAVGATAGARAADLPSLIVSANDLDLSRPADVDALYGRLQLAAMGACLPLPQQSLTYEDWQRCSRAVLEASIRRMHSPELLARYRDAEQVPVALPRRG